ncbi:tripartite tricarboxylate transporter substrate-binding protein [Roseomonas populi]|uniref:Tripartite tricarboxylate transporter substrate-binding protein n=1 Tax=Roseomonas populi TaxID=3121582 RepID=A0ABT1X5F7_9PROT|nr:tripartite tricarboxylate transporter substrate-binding protein [Roseomonas pecuniae]MCR0983346.1 tripartite tricarboxylate transporter substrate-binding protein [Roseomonas pecuniae]
MTGRRDLLAALAAAPLLGRSGTARAQARPNAWLVLGFPPGGLGDVVSQPLLERLRGRYAATMLIDHRPGASGRIAAEYVKRAAPDGATILQVPGSVMSLYPHIYRALRYDPLADFTPAVALCTYTYALVAGPGLPTGITTPADYLAWARANPRGAHYGIPATGSPMHFAGMMLGRRAGLELEAVPFRGGAPLMQNLLGGQIPVGFTVLTEALNPIREGRLRALAVLDGDRSPFLPNIPTLAESGYPDIRLRDWLGWFLPAGTPPETVARLNAAVREGLETPAYAEILSRNALTPMGQPPQAFAETFRADHARWAAIARETGFTADD